MGLYPQTLRYMTYFMFLMQQGGEGRGGGIVQMTPAGDERMSHRAGVGGRG